jgi:hypothetical protein
MNGAELFMISQEVLDPTPDSVHLNMTTKAVSHTIFTPTLDAFDADLFLESTLPDYKAFGTITIPGMHVTKELNTTVDQVMQIKDKDQFNVYNTLVSQAESFKVAMKGKTKLHLGALPVVEVVFSKVITMKGASPLFFFIVANPSGLNGFKGLTVDVQNLSATHFEDGSNMKGTINLPNPSVMTLTIGDVVQDIFLPDGTLIGTSTISGVVLKPGNDNNFPLSSTTNISLVLPYIFKSNTGDLPITAKTTTVTYQGQRLPYFEAAMAATPVNVTLHLKTPLLAIGIDVDALSAPKGGSSSTTAAAAPSATP